MLGDKGLIRPELQEKLRKVGLNLEYPLRSNMVETRSPKYLKVMKDQRRIVETVIGQLSERFHIEKVRGKKNLWRLGNRFMRKILAHTVGLFLNKQLDRPMLRLEGLVA